MYEYAISDSTVSTNPFLPKLLQCVEQVSKQGVRVYHTYADTHTDSSSDGGEYVTFVTTSKDVHISLGRLDWDASCHLAGLLQHEFERKCRGGEGMTQMLLYGFLDRPGLLVTRTREADEIIIFTLSPAN